MQVLILRIWLNEQNTVSMNSGNGVLETLI